MIKRSCHLLYVEDKIPYRDEVCRLIRRILGADYDVKIECFRDVESAENYLKSKHLRDIDPIDVALLDYLLPSVPEVRDEDATPSLPLTAFCLDLKPALHGVLQLTAHANDPELKDYWQDCARRGVRGELWQKGDHADQKVPDFIRQCLEYRDVLEPLGRLSKQGLLAPRTAELCRGRRSDLDEVVQVAQLIRSEWQTLTEKTREEVRARYFDVEEDENGSALIVSFKRAANDDQEVPA